MTHPPQSNQDQKDQKAKQEPREVMTDEQIDALSGAIKLRFTSGLRGEKVIEPNAEMLLDLICRQAKRALPAVSVVPGAKVLGREPTEEMMQAGIAVLDGPDSGGTTGSYVNAAWRAMFDAAR